MTAFNSVWDALEDTSEQAHNMKIRSDLMISITRFIERIEGTQALKAQKLGLTQPRLNDLLKGRINKFSLDALVNIATRAGLRVSVEVA